MHCAAESHVDRSIYRPWGIQQHQRVRHRIIITGSKEYWATDFEGNVFSHISTDEVYGSWDGKTGFLPNNRLRSP